MKSITTVMCFGFENRCLRGVRGWFSSAAAVLSVGTVLVSLPVNAENLVANGSFEEMTGTVSGHSGLWDQFSSTLQADGWAYETTAVVGFAKTMNNTWFSSSCRTPDGEWSVFFNQNASISRDDIVVSEAGYYSVSLKYVSRGSSYASGRFYITIGDTAVGDPIDVGSGKTMFRYAESRIYLEPGTYTLTIRHSDENNVRGSTGDGACSAIDAVAIQKVDNENLVRNGSFEGYNGALTKAWEQFVSAISIYGWTQSSGSAMGLADSTNGTWFASPCEIPDGSLALFMNQNGSITQEIDVEESGMYIVGLDYISRGKPVSTTYGDGLIYLEVDGSQVGSPVDVGSVRTVFRTALWKLPLAAGSHALTIRHSDENNVRVSSTSAGGACSSIDDVFVRKTDKLILNGDFDYGTAVEKTTWSYSVESTFSNPGWSQSGEVGLSESNTTWVSSSLSTVGTYALFLQTANFPKRSFDSAAVWQTFDIDRDGMYNLTFSYAARPNYAGGPLYVRVYKGEGTSGTKVWEDSVTATSVDAFLQFDKEVKLDAAGSYTIEFYAPQPDYSESSNDKAVILDNVVLEYSRSIPGLVVIAR